MYDATLLSNLAGQGSRLESADTDGVANEPITLAKAKAHLRVVCDDEDDYIAGLITAAREMAEGRLNRTLVQRQLTVAFPAWCVRMALPKPPLVSVDSVVYLDTDGVEQSLDEYDVQEYATPAAISLSYGTPVPALRWRPDAIRVTYTAGYADGNVPAPILSWMLLVIGSLYENRETLSAGMQVYSIPDDFMSWMLQPYMVYE